MIRLPGIKSIFFINLRAGSYLASVLRCHFLLSSVFLWISHYIPAW